MLSTYWDPLKKSTAASRTIFWDMCKSSAWVSRGAHVAFSAKGCRRRLEGTEVVHRSKVRAFILQWRHLVREAQGTLRNLFEGSDFQMD